MNYHTAKKINVKAQLISEDENSIELDILDLSTPNIKLFPKELVKYDYEEEELLIPFFLLEKMFPGEFIQ